MCLRWEETLSEVLRIGIRLAGLAEAPSLAFDREKTLQGDVRPDS